MKSILLFLFLSVFLQATAQKRYVDSIKNILAHTKNDSIKLNQYALLADYYLLHKPDSCIVYSEKIIQWSKIHLNNKGTDYGMYDKGYAYYRTGNYPAAIKLELKVLQDFERDTSKVNLANLYNAIGNIYKGQQNFLKASYYYYLCKNLAEKIHDIPDYSFATMNIAFVHLQLNKLDSAIYYLDKFIGRKAFSGQDDCLPFVYNTLGDVYFKQKKFNIAYANYKKGLILARRADDFDGVSENARGLSLYYKRLNNADSALYYATIANTASNVSDYKLDMYKSSVLLADIYESDHKLDSAYKYLKISMAVNDSLYNAQKAQDFANATTDESVRQDAIKSAVKDYNDRIRVYILIGVTAVVLLIAFFLWRNSRNQKKAYKLLSRQKKEIDIQKEATDKALVALGSTQSQLIQSEKMASLGELTAGIAHEIQNPLNFVNNFSEVSIELIDEMNEELTKGDTNDIKIIAADIKQNLEKILHHGRRADGIIKGMLQHSRASSTTKEPTDINKLADEYLRLAYHGLRAKDKSFNAEMITSFNEKLPLINVVPQDIGRVLLNLFTNAFYAVIQKQKTDGVDYKPTITVSTSVDKGILYIKVKDNGSGIPDTIKDKIMQPFFTTKPAGEGTGLGLSLSYDIIVKGHGGNLNVLSNEGEYTEFIISIPL